MTIDSSETIENLFVWRRRRWRPMVNTPERSSSVWLNHIEFCFVHIQLGLLNYNWRLSPFESGDLDNRPKNHNNEWKYVVCHNRFKLTMPRVVICTFGERKTQQQQDKTKFPAFPRQFTDNNMCSKHTIHWNHLRIVHHVSVCVGVCYWVWKLLNASYLIK